MSDSIRRRLPGGKMVTGVGAHAAGWREAIRPFIEGSGWVIHSFLENAIVVMSKDMKHKQVISIEFCEAMQAALAAAQKNASDSLHVVRSGDMVSDEGKETHHDSTARQLRIDN